MIVKNESKHVIALKAVGMPQLRLFPGYNEVKKEDFEKYFEGNPAAKGQAKLYLTVVNDDLSPEDKEKAKAAKAKNDELNKAQKIIAKQTKELEKHARSDGEKDKEIEALKKKIEALENVSKKDKKDK